jgi:3'-5' exoribonuclease
MNYEHLLNVIHILQEEDKIMDIRTLKPDEKVDGKFVVKFKKPPEQYKRGVCFQLRLGGKDGEIMLKFWGPNDPAAVQAFYDLIKKDCVVQVLGMASLYRDNLEVSVNSFDGIRVCLPGEYDPKEFVEEAENIPGMFDELASYIDSVKDPDLQKILSAFFSDQAFLDTFKYGTAAMYKHHARRGGLLQHTLSVVKLCSMLCEHYPKLDRDLVITGAVLHDIGKVREFDITTNIKTSTEGMLVGHVVIALEMLYHKTKDLDIAQEVMLKVRHIILSHHGELEYGSPKTPCFPEAMMVHYADSLDAAITQMLDHKENPGTEDDYVYTKDFGNIYLR